MDDKCWKTRQVGLFCRLGDIPTEHSPTGASAGSARPGGISFGAESTTHAPREVATPIPGYNAPALPMKPSRDPALSLIALSGAPPAEQVMVEVPLVLNNSAFTPAHELAGWRIGFDHRHARSACLLDALQVLRLAGALTVPVDVAWDRIDQCVIEYRLDALICEQGSPGFQSAQDNGNPCACEVLEDATRVWFYGARWAGERLTGLTRVFRQVLRQTSGRLTRVNA